MADNHRQEFIDVLETFDYAMLVTQRDSELRSRPMAIADRSGDGRVWFITRVDSAKLQEITDYPDVNVAMQAGSTFLSISGTVRANRDGDRINELWNDVQELWYPEGRNDPNMILLEVVPTFAEYWEGSGVEASKFTFDAANSNGRTHREDEGRHGKLRFPDTA